MYIAPEAERVLNENKGEIPKLYFDIQEEAVYDEALSQRDGCARYVNKVFLVWTKIGAINPISNRAEIEPKNIAAKSVHIWEHAGGRKFYERWRNGESGQHVNGTPLKAWPLITPAQVKELEHINVRSVEDLAGMEDMNLDRAGMGVRSLRDKAQAWLKEAANKGVLTEENAALNREMKDIRVAMKEMQETLDAQADKLRRTDALENEVIHLRGELEKAKAANVHPSRPTRQSK